jgi:cell division protein FtsB
VLAANLALFALAAWGFAGEYVRNRDMQREIDELEARATDLETTNADLADLAERLASPQAAEREARLKLNLKRPGEEVIVVRGAGQRASEPDAAPAGPVPARSTSNVGKWWRHFFRSGASAP